jgi:hypothetical protein
MIEMAVAALRARWSATVTAWLLATLVIAGAVAAPWAREATAARVLADDMAQAPTDARAVTMSRSVTLSTAFTATAGSTTALVDEAFTTLRRALPLDSVDTVLADGSVGAPISANIVYAYRADFCAHVRLDGRCPSATGEALVSRSVADALRWTTGATVPWTALGRNGLTLRVVGVYQPLDPIDPWWGTGLLGVTSPSGRLADAVFVTRDTVEKYAQTVRCERQIAVTDADIRRSGAVRVAADIDAARTDGNQHGYSVDSRFSVLAARIGADSDATSAAISVLAVELVAFGLYAAFLVLRTMATQRRGDLAIGRLRGVPASRARGAVALQHALPVLAALPVGVAAGALGGWLLTGEVPADARGQVARLAALSIGVVLFGAALLAAFAGRRTARTPVMDLWRAVPPRRRGWPTMTADIAVVVLATAAAIQAQLAPNGPAGFAAAAPACVAVAAAVLTARLVALAARRSVAGAGRLGRPDALLTATELGRRPGLDRVLVLLTVAVAAMAGPVLGWRAAADARATRAVQELGADRVITLRGVTIATLLADAHAADPAGRWVLAAAHYPGVVAVDSPRLGAVLAPGGGWPSAEALTEALHRDGPVPAEWRDGPVDARIVATVLPARPAALSADLVDADGAAHRVRFDALTLGDHAYRGTLAGCPSGCELVDLRVLNVADDGPAEPSSGVDLVVASIGPTDLGLGDRDRWRTAPAVDSIGPALAAGPDGLRITLADDTLSHDVRFDGRVFPAVAPLPLPAVAAGAAGSDGGVPTVQPFADLKVPVEVNATAAVLPQVWPGGMLVDLTDALRLDSGAGTGAVPQLWMRADTPPEVVTRAVAGHSVVSDRSTGALRDAYRGQAPGIVTRIRLAAGVVALLAALATAALAAGTDRAERAAELLALRRQGLAGRDVTRASYAAQALPAVVAIVVGLVAAGLGRLAVTDAVFADGWAVPPPPRTDAAAWLLAAIAVAVPLLASAARAAHRLRRAVGDR